LSFFDISVLAKLAETRANDPVSGSLLDFIISTLENSYPDSMAWTKELEDLKYAKEASWDKIDTLIKELKAALMVIKGLISGVPLLPQPTVDRFGDIKEAIIKAEEEFDETKILYDAVVDDWNNLAKLYAKDPTKVKPEQFFQSIYEFVAKFESAIVDREKRIKDLEKKRNTEKAQADLKKRKEDLQKKKMALAVKDDKNDKKKEQDEEEVLQENLTGMLKSLVTTGQKERREVRSREKAQTAAATTAPTTAPTAAATAPTTTTTSEQTDEQPLPPADTRAPEVNREDDKAARRAALQAKQRARRAALEAKAAAAAAANANNGEGEPDM